MAVVIAIAGSVPSRPPAAPVTTYGSARWATGTEVREAGLLGAGRRAPRPLADRTSAMTGPSMSWLRADPQRQGRRPGRADLALPGPVSAVIHDIKGENWQLTAGWRSRFSHCLLFDPTDAALGALQSAARGAARRRGSPRRPEHRRHPGRSRKARSSGATTGRRPATRCWSARSSTSSTPKRTRRWPASRAFLSDPGAADRRDARGR